MYPAILYENKEIFVSMTPEEFVELLEKEVAAGKTVKEAMDMVIKNLKRSALTV